MPELVQGRQVGSSRDDQAYAAEHLFKAAIRKGTSDPGSVLKSLSPAFGAALSLALQNSPQVAAMSQFVSQLNAQLTDQLGKSITLTSPNPTGLVPFDLVAPTQLIYPLFSPLRNLIPRTQGQGTVHRAKVMTSISGALPGQLGVTNNRFSIPELPGGGSISGTNGGNWPTQLPPTGTQQAVDVNVPYKYFGLTEATSLLAQVAGQGFEDAAGLASLILLQEMMVLEERAMIGSTSIALSAPGSPGVTSRAAGTGELPLTGVSTNLYVAVTALNYYGETAASATVTPTSNEPGVSSVADVLITPVPGALAYNIYVGTGTTTPARTAMYLMAAAVGSTRFTLQGALPTSGANPPAADTGTAQSTDYEGFIPTISGHSASGGSAVYPAGYQGSYVNLSGGDIFSENLINTGLSAMWDGPSGIFADPDDIWAEGGDLTRLAGSLANQNNSANPNNYRFFIQQDQVSGVRAGVAVSEYTNPVTRKVINLRVHPYIPQGTAMALSYRLPQPWTNVGNVWENVMVQDYLSISWPVIDLSFRYSLLMYGTLFSPAVQYNGLWQGIQKTTVSNGGTYS